MLKEDKRTNFMRGIYQQKRAIDDFIISIQQYLAILSTNKEERKEQTKIQSSRNTTKVIARISKHLSTIFLNLNIPN